MDRITLAEAGTTPAILRKRAQRGTLAGALKVAGAWYVETPTGAPGGTPGQDTARPTGVGIRQERGGDTVETIALLRRENDRLWEELAARRREVERLHTLLAQAQAQTQARVLSPAEGQHSPAKRMDPSSPAAAAERGRPRAPWWRRLFTDGRW
jgi:hypothetical protein